MTFLQRFPARTLLAMIAALACALLAGPTAPAHASDQLQMRVYLANDSGYQTPSSGPAGTTYGIWMYLGSTQANTVDAAITATWTPADTTTSAFSKPWYVAHGYTNCTSSPYCSFGREPFTPTGPGTLTLTTTPSPLIAAATWSMPFKIWTTQPRATTDQKDTAPGFQIHPVYVVPSDGTDMGRDTSGELASALNDASRWQDTQVGDHLQIDMTNGHPDVTYLHSKYPLAVLQDKTKRGNELLLNEFAPGLPQGGNRKTYLFMVEMPRIYDLTSTVPAEVNGQICGYASQPGRTVILAAGANRFCDTARAGIPELSFMAIHETLHTFGVDHVADDPQDLMSAYFTPNTPTLDPTHTKYVGGAKNGVDVEKLPVWSKHPVSSTSTSGYCLPGTTAHTFLCTRGAHRLDPTGLCWPASKTPMKIQELRRGTWVQVSTTTSSRQTECSSPGFGYSYRPMISTETVGQHRYRLLLPGWSQQVTVAIQW